MSNIDEAFKLIRDNPDAGAHWSGEKSEELIERAEAALGYRFPSEYRRFVKEFGCGNLAGCEFYGLTRSEGFEPGVPDAVGLTLEAWEKGHIKEPYLWISAIGEGSDVLLQLKLGSVYILDHDGENNWESGDFGEYLLDTLTEALKDWDND